MHIAESAKIEGGNLGWGWEIPGRPRPLYEMLITPSVHSIRPSTLKYIQLTYISKFLTFYIPGGYILQLTFEM